MVVSNETFIYKILKGMQKSLEVLKISYGPRGGTVALNRFSGMLSTRDGSSLIREIEFSDPLEDLGRKLLKEACLEVEKIAGDGTTTTAILTVSFLEEILKLLLLGIPFHSISETFREYSEKILHLFEEIKHPVSTAKDLYSVCLQSTHQDKELSEIIQKACMAVGKGGILMACEGKGTASYVESRSGIYWDRGSISDYLVPEKPLDDCLLALIPRSLFKIEDVTEILSVASQWPDHPLVIVAPTIEGDALRTIQMNKKAGNLQCFGVSLPRWKVRPLLEDLKALSGGEIIDSEAGKSVESFDPEWFGVCRSVEITSKTTLVVGYEDKFLEEKEAQIKKIESENSGSSFDKTQGEKRIACLSGSVCLLHVGGFTSSEIQEKRSRLEDALHSVKGSISQGVLPGGGHSFFVASEYLKEEFKKSPERRAFNLALEKPIKILLGKGGNGSWDFEKLKKLAGSKNWVWTGWDMEKGEIRSFKEDPYIFDSALSLSSILKVSLSIALSTASLGAVYIKVEK